MHINMQHEAMEKQGRIFLNSVLKLVEFLMCYLYSLILTELNSEQYIQSLILIKS